MARITINEGLAWLKTLKKRHEGLLALRNDDTHRERRFDRATRFLCRALHTAVTGEPAPR